MAWWVWILLGFGLVGGEVITPGAFFFMFFGIGAIAVGLLVWLDAVGSPALQWLLFSLISLGCLIPLRSRLLRRIGAGEDVAKHVDTIVGQIAVLLDDIPPGDLGKAELRGTAWSAHNADRKPLHKGQRGKVTRVEGLTLWLQAE